MDLEPVLFSQHRENVPIKIGVAFPRLRRDELAFRIDDALLVDPGAAALLDFKADVSIARHGSSSAQPSGEKNLDAVANGENPLPASMKFLNDLDQLVVVAKAFRGASSNQQNGFVLTWLDLRDGDVGLDQVAGLLDVSRPARFEVVKDAVEDLLLRGRDDRLVAGFAEAVLRVEDFEGFAGVVGYDQNSLGHSR